MVYAGVWLAVPRSEGITGQGFDGEVLAYLLQGAAYPITAPMARLPGAWAGPVSVALVSMAAPAVLAVSLHRCGQGREAILALVLTAVGMAPVWAGLSWEYVKVGSRLLYPAIVGIAALWGAVIVGGLAPGNRAGVRIASGGLLLLALGVSLRQWHAFHRLYDIGTRHMAAMISACAAHPGERLVFVNFPDRLGLRRAPYPLGYWGLTLAPVAQDLKEYALLSTGSACETTSISSFVSGLEGREASPYRVDMRGENQGPEGVLLAARGAEAVFITDYAADGELTLRRLGRVATDDGRPAIAIYGDRVELVDWEAAECTSFREDAVTHMRLTWHPIGPRSPGDTIFVHLLTVQGQLARGADGDALGRLLPMETWEEGKVIDEWRQVSLQGLPPGDYRLAIGVYNRITGVRYPALTRAGIRIPDDAFALTTLTARPAATSAMP